MVTLSEAKPSMVKRVEGWTPATIRACLEGMGELPEEGLEVWLEADVCLSAFFFWLRLILVWEAI